MRYLDRREQAEYLQKQHNIRYSPKTLQRLATSGGGPRYCIFGGRALSTPEWMDAWVEAKMSAPRHSTSEVA